MNYIASIFQTWELDFTMNVKPRTVKDIEGTPIKQASMFRPHQSKVGNVSLIFDPTIYLGIRPRRNNDQNIVALITPRQFYRFTSAMTQVYNNCVGKGVFQEDGGIYLDPKMAAGAARRLSLYNSSLTLFPDIISGSNNEQQRAIGFQLDKTKLGSITLTEALSLVDVLDHVDLTTYTLLAGILERLEDQREDHAEIIDRLVRIEQILNSMTVQPKPVERRSSTAGIFDWETGKNPYSIGS